MASVPSRRISSDGAPIASDGDYVLYWMTSARRTRHNFALTRAIELANSLDKPLLVFEPLRAAYEHHSPRFHAFIMAGMADQAEAFGRAGVTYLPYVEPTPDDDKGLLAALAEPACAVVGDFFPCFFLSRMQESARKVISVRFERVDGNGLLPIAAAERSHPTAHSLRRHLQKVLPPHLEERSEAEPLKSYRGGAATIPPEVLKRWPAVTPEVLADPTEFIASSPLDHSVGVVDLRGGQQSALEHLDQFMLARFPRYAEARNHPEDPVTSGLSPWLHFGHLSSTEIFERIIGIEDWGPVKLGTDTKGARRGWWGMSEAAEGFLDQLITWRELGYHLCTYVERFDRFETLPEWAQKTLDDHRDDRRDPCYSLEEFEAGETADPLWNAAQEQLRRDGMIHNYLRMLWGKKVLHWAESPEEAYRILIHLNNKYALDGRNPNSYSAISWIFGRFDRAWGPERPIFGKIRYMSSENTARKVRVREYVREYTS